MDQSIPSLTRAGEASCTAGKPESGTVGVNPVVLSKTE